MRKMENRFTAMQKGLAMMGGHVGKKKPVKKPVPKEIKVPKNIFDARRVGMKFLSEAGFGAHPEVKFKNRILRSNDPVEIRGIIDIFVDEARELGTKHFRKKDFTITIVPSGDKKELRKYYASKGFEPIPGEAKMQLKP